MVHLVVESELHEGSEFRPLGDDLHYLLRVRRLRTGASLSLMDGAGRRWDAVIDQCSDNAMVLRVVGQSDSTAPRAEEFSPAISVYQAIPKGRRFDDAVRLLVQGGASHIVPLLTERTIVDPSGNENKLERWRRVAREAAQQSGAEGLVSIDPPVHLPDVVIEPSASTFFLHTSPIADQTLHGYLGRTPQAIALLVGPEGGFSPGEIDELLDRGAEPVWLGPRILRSENAGFFAVAAVRVLLLERAVWQEHE